MFGYAEHPVASLIMQFYHLGALDAYIYGRNTHLIGRFPRTKRQLLHLMTNWSQAYACMHQAGVVHCDIKPGNVLLDERNTKLTAVLTDFGIARILSDKQLEVAAF